MRWHFWATECRVLEGAGPASGASLGMLTAVLLLYGIYVLCTVALVWTAIAVTRHIVQQRRMHRSQTEHHDEHV